MFNVFGKTNPLGVLFIALEDKLPKSIDEVADSLRSLAGSIKKTSDAVPPSFKKGEFSDAIIPDFDNAKATGPIRNIRPPEKLPSMLPKATLPREPDDFGTAIRKMEASGGNNFRANGGPVNAGGSYVVGEHGPELFFPTKTGHILSNGLSKKVDGMFADGTNDLMFIDAFKQMDKDLDAWLKPIANAFERSGKFAAAGSQDETMMKDLKFQNWKTSLAKTGNQYKRTPEELEKLKESNAQKREFGLPDLPDFAKGYTRNSGGNYTKKPTMLADFSLDPIAFGTLAEGDLKPPKPKPPKPKPPKSAEEEEFFENQIPGVLESGDFGLEEEAKKPMLPDLTGTGLENVRPELGPQATLSSGHPIIKMDNYDTIGENIGMEPVDTSGMVSPTILPEIPKPDLNKMAKDRQRAQRADRKDRMDEARARAFWEQDALPDDSRTPRGTFQRAGSTAAARKRARRAQVRERLEGHSPQAAMNDVVPDAPAIPRVDQGADANKAGQNAVNSVGAVKQLEMMNTALGEHTQLLSKIEGNTKNNGGVITS